MKPNIKETHMTQLIALLHSNLPFRGEKKHKDFDNIMEKNRFKKIVMVLKLYLLPQMLYIPI